MERALIENLWQCIGRRDTFAVQLSNGQYARVFRSLTHADLVAHLVGRITIGSYLLDLAGLCRFAVLDADMENGLAMLRGVQSELAPAGQLVVEASRRGGHGWLFFDEQVAAREVRAWLSPIAQAHGLELYPKQDATGRGVGSLIRVPLGIHRRSGRRYPFLGDDLRPVGHRVSDILAWLPSAPRSALPTIVSQDDQAASSTIAPARAQKKSFSLSPTARYSSIREWNAAHDPFAVIGRYVDLGRNGAGRCPFGEHHAGGRDDHHSFQVYQPHAPGGYCWLCHAGGIGGSLFDFLRLYYGLSARELWHRLQTGGGVW